MELGRSLEYPAARIVVADPVKESRVYILPILGQSLHDTIQITPQKSSAEQPLLFHKPPGVSPSPAPYSH